MANEISVSVNVQVANPSTAASTGGQLKSAFQPTLPKITQNANLVFERVIDTSTADTALTITGITTLGWCCLQNLDGTNNIDWGATAAGAIAPIGTLKPGECAVFRLKSGITFRYQSSAGTPKLWIKVFND